MAKKKPNFEAYDSLMEVILGTDEEPRMTKISNLLPRKSRDQLVQLIRMYWDCFA